MAKTEEKLIELAAGGDMSALGELWKLHEARLLGFVNKHVHSFQTAEDLVQTIFMKTFIGLPTFEKDREFFPWVCGIAKLTVRQHLRDSVAQKRDERKNVPLVDLSAALSDAGVAEPRDTFEEDELVRALTAAIEELDDTTQVVIMLFDFEYMTYAKVGQQIGITEANAKIIRHRGIRRLKVLLSDWRAEIGHE